MKADWIVPRWDAPAHVRAVCTTRAGGVSKAPYDSLNLGDHVSDTPTNVAQNRARLASQMQARPVFLTQVHGTQVARVSADTPDGTVADGAVTQGSRVACTVMVADCLPVLLTNRRGDFVAAAHAGWRGLAGNGQKGVLEAIFEQIVLLAPDLYRDIVINSVATDILAWVGPCIGPDKFEVGGEVRDAFCAHDAGAISLFKPQPRNKWLADLPALARRRLNALGVTDIRGNDGSDAWCTVSQRSRFFSHRRDHLALGGSGRMAACIWLD